jgi:ribosome maturation factor RimP
LDKYALAREACRLLESELAASGFDLLDVRVFRGGGRVQVRVFLDAAGGIDLDGCARASRTVDMLLEEADLIPGPYVIEVSSPGIRRPLRRPDHFAAVVGQRIEALTGAADRPRRVRGELLAADDAGLLVRTPGGPDAPPQEIAVAYGEVLEADLDPDFDAQALIREDRRRRKDEQRQQRAERRGRRRTGKRSE